VEVYPLRDGRDRPGATSAGTTDVEPHETGITLNTDDIDTAHAEMKSRGVDVDAEVARMGGPVPPMFWFRDPDGHT